MTRFSVLTAAALAALSVRTSAQTTTANTVTYDSRACQAPYDAFPFCNTSLSIDERVANLVSLLELSDIPPLLTARHGGGGSPGPNDNITRLGIPEFDYGLNAIHGVQSSCVSDSGTVYCPVSFANPVNFGMTFNKSLGRDMAAVIGIETRALWLAGAVEASTWSGRPHIGLDTWSPNININRDPRWGRNCEVPSEDPVINGDFGVSYTQGLQQGADPNYLQAVVTLKHWDAYSLEDSDGYTRYNFNAIVSEYGLADTFFPAFKRAVIDGNAQGIMCSYNAVNGQPTCANDYLRHALREVWNFTGYITSDSGALEDIYQQHKYVQTEAEAACVAIRNGSCDVCSGAVYHDSLLQGVQQGLCTMDNVNAALSRTFAMRMRLGLFDPAENQPYWHVPLSAVNTTASQALNLLATQSSMVLLKNDKNMLPLKKGIKLAVIGPFANTQEALVGNYLGQLCADNSLSCVTTPFQAFSDFNVGGTTQMVNGCNITTNYTNGFQQAVALAKQCDAVVLVMGIDGTIEGESHDRTSIDLPSVQHQLAAAIAALNIPTVLILINGGMVDITPEKASIPAIIEAGYPGTAGAVAMASTIFGDNDHLGGRLPYTIYPANFVNEILMSEMEMDVGVGRSYRYYNGTVVYPFGWGLSYTTFQVVAASPMNAASFKTEAAPSSNVSYSVSVTNTGAVTGDTVILAYFAPVSLPSQPQNRLIKQLFAYERVHLAPGESTTLTFTATSATVNIVDKATGDIVSAPGSFNFVFTDGVDQTLTVPATVTGSQVVVHPYPAGVPT